jgi:biopolymer transport protein TolQ
LNVHADLSILALVAQSSLVVKIVLIILLALSFWSWLRIGMKILQLRRAQQESMQFEDEFWRGGDLNAIYQSLGAARVGDGMKHIFVSGFREYTKHRKQGGSSAVAVDATRRAMRVAFQRELDALDAGLPGLATIGSVSPYIGLFGTVWGIMNSFRGLASVSQATLAQVAPGIAEALIATALGLFAAIPAVIAYNRFTHDVDRIAIRYETFIEEFANILQRQSV